MIKGFNSLPSEVMEEFYEVTPPLKTEVFTSTHELTQSYYSLTQSLDDSGIDYDEDALLLSWVNAIIELVKTSSVSQKV